MQHSVFLTCNFLQKVLAKNNSSMFSQGALEIYIKSGMFGRHIHLVRNVYDDKAKKLRNAFEHNGMAELLPPSNIKGAKTFLQLPDTIHQVAFIRSLRKKGLLLEGMEKNYYTPAPDDKRLKLDLANIDLERIEDAVLDIRETIIKIDRMR
jgi:DNA-binding transcriptional MocR family regulator